MFCVFYLNSAGSCVKYTVCICLCGIKYLVSFNAFAVCCSVL